MKKKSFPNFIIIWSGQLMSGLGSGISAFALGVFVYRKTQSAASFALVILCLFLPSILLRPIGGVLADRFNRKSMIIIGDIGSASGMVFLLMTVMSGNVDLWKIYSGVAVTSAFTALQNPAYKALISDLLTRDQFSKAGGMVQLASSVQHLFSPVIAGLLLSISNIRTILMFDILTFIIAVFTVFWIDGVFQPEVNHVKQNIFRDLNEGWQTVTSDQGVLSLVVTISIVTFFIGFLQTLFSPMVLSFSDAATLGIVQSVSASGMLLSSLLLSFKNISNKERVVLIMGLGLAGISLSLIGLTTRILVITGAFFLFYAALPLINTSAEVLIRNNIPNDKQGRAWGIIGVLSQIGFIGAYSISGYLADHVFNPLLLKGGAFASSVGKIIGVGPGRGAGLMLFISGICVVFAAIMTAWINSFGVSAIIDFHKIRVRS